MRQLARVGVVALLLIVISGLLVTAAVKVQEAAAVMRCQSNLKHIGLAVYNYHDLQGWLPPATMAQPHLGPEQRLSWQVLITPYIECDNLYKQFKHDKGWQAEENAEFQTVEYVIFRCPAHAAKGDKGQGSYVGIAGVGEDAALLPAGDKRSGAFGHDRKIKMDDITDGRSETLLVIETARDNGPWIAGGRPTVRGVDPDHPPVGDGRDFGRWHAAPGFWSPARPAAQVTFADGSVRQFRPSACRLVFAKLATIAGGEELPNDF